MDDNSGFLGGLLDALMGPDRRATCGTAPASTVSRTRKRRSAMASMGREAMDVWEPIKQMYLDKTDPIRAAAYRQQRAEDERLYQRGALAANPLPPDAHPQWANMDTWRQTGLFNW